MLTQFSAMKKAGYHIFPQLLLYVETDRVMRMEVNHDGPPLKMLINKKMCEKMKYEFSDGGGVLFQKCLLYLVL